MQFYIDLDELVLLCRDIEAQKNITEAVSCYKAGAFRSCIVSTWIAIVFDFIHKLRELELAGDNKARQELEIFDSIRKNADVKKSLIFEHELLEKALKDYEFISPMEYADLQRLHEDRNRCAHPSMNSVEEAYHPSAELARYHLRNAITHLLQHPPVQGKAALNRLESDISSRYFPTSKEEAIEYFSYGPLANPREALVRNFVLLLVKKLLLSYISPSAKSRSIAALNAVRQMYFSISENTLSQNLNKVAARVEDDNLQRVIEFLCNIHDTWQYIGDDVQGRIARYINEMPIGELVQVFEQLRQVSSLASNLEERISQINDLKDFRSLTTIYPCKQLTGNAIRLYANVSSYDSAVYCRKYILPQLCAYFSNEQVDKIISVLADNRYARNDYAVDYLFNDLLQAESIKSAQLVDMFIKYDLSEKYDSYIASLDKENNDERLAVH
ncbi:MAG: hypothetical protein R3A44_12840 [Caldilineaceae bacterium]